MGSDFAGGRKLRSGSDIRGSRKLLTDDLVARIGFTFARKLAHRIGVTTDKLCVSVGCDSAEEMAVLKDALIQGLRSADSDVLDCGASAAPAVAATCADGRAHGAIMATGHYKASDVCDLKFFTNNGALSSDDTESLLEEALNCELPDPLVREEDSLTPYCEKLVKLVRSNLGDDSVKPLLGIRVIIDALCGTGAFFIDLLDSLGADVYGSRRDVRPEADTDAHVPDSDAEIRAISQAVIANRADLGIVLDADCTRAAFVDNCGNRLDRDRLIALISVILLDKKPEQTIVTDSVTSSGLATFITEWGGIHYRFKRGYHEVINEARRLNEEGIDCPLAIETSGHAAFRDNDFIDDGLYLATWLICENLKRKYDGLTLTSLIDDLAEPVERVEIRLPILGDDMRAAGQEVIETVLSYTLDHPEWQVAPDNREGVRISFNLDGGVRNAWFLLRMSVHDPVMPLNAESDIPGGIDRILTALYDTIKDCEALDLSPLKTRIGL